MHHEQNHVREESYSTLYAPPQCEVVASELAEKIMKERPPGSRTINSAAIHHSNHLAFITGRRQVDPGCRAPHGEDWQANAREVRRLRAVIQATHTTLVPFMALSESTTANVEWLNLELRTAGNDLRELEASDWGPYSSSEALSSIRHGGAFTLLAAMDTSESVLSVPQSYVSTIFRRIEAEIRPMEGRSRTRYPQQRKVWWLTLQMRWRKFPATLAKVVSRSYDEGLVGLVGSQVPLVQGVLDVLASHLKPVFFGAKVVEECLKNFNDLKTLETALNIRVAAMKNSPQPSTDTLLKIHSPKSCSRQHAAAYVQALEGLQTSLTYANVQSSSQDYEAQEDFVLVSEGIFLAVLMTLIRKRADTERTAMAPEPAPTTSRMKKIIHQGRRIFSSSYKNNTE
ncbi:hypothetical protein B0H13DRAFT_2344675 [Mycena leptocephala]|nr:hypothetical protein B0H13DRAFT_2344675 [Mycena leptocephala]